MQEPVYLYSNQREAKNFRSITVLSATERGREPNLSGSESDMYTQYMLGVRFFRACHLALCV